MAFFDEGYSGRKFIMADKSYDDAAVVLFGMPMDWTASFRPGSRFGPNRIREASIGLEEYSLDLDRHLEDVPVHDRGDMLLPFGNAARSIEMIGAWADQLFADGKWPIGLGGEHLVSWPLIRSAAAHFNDLAVIHIDAHADLREEYEGEVLSHSTPIRKTCERIGPENVYSFGIRSGMQEEFAYAKRSGMTMHVHDVLEPLQSVLPELAGRPVYVTIDIDVLDPAFAPGTGTPEAGGISSRELLASIREIARSKVNVIGCDLVETLPAYDQAEITAVSASKCVREMLLGFRP
ncbi:agmatinase [Salisediminibacterium halotolerans]|uniref:agmatinase n=1 Tax=Salisediminibacterium halotolerans TaxID=517425 RepID=UPI000EB58CB3|nr:agmatinase [Salisediminibacterium halotolerans]RLJ69637.1 agmatinase [Actinophytocola xinjiangensis]RPE89695.1 agmatinase [Salisediminibacterium halotolerans]TWG32531.1 agmatinase [Salisediminibacterium halotolerans]GEL09072.1 agmatinase [Salisediminibacterium halotolerans]